MGAWWGAASHKWKKPTKARDTKLNLKVLQYCQAYQCDSRPVHAEGALGPVMVESALIQQVGWKTEWLINAMQQVSDGLA